MATRHYNTPDTAPTDLHRLLLKATPKNRHGRQTISHLASLLGLTTNGVYMWIRKDRIEPQRVMQIVNLSEGRVSISDFSRYVFQMPLDLEPPRS